MAERTILFDVKLDIAQLEKNSKEARDRLYELRQRQKDLKDSSLQNTVEYAKLSNEIRATSKQLKDNASAIEINERLNKKNTGSLNEQSEALKSAKIAYRNLSEEQRNSPMGEEMRDNIDKMNTALKDSESAYGDNQRNVGNYSDALGQVPGATGQATNSIKAMSASLKALLANPVVLVIAGIVAVLGTLYKAFTRSEEGQNSMAKATAVVSSLFETLMDVVTMVANFLVDAFSKPQESIKKFAKLVKDNIFNRFEGLLELIPALGRAIGELFSGNFEKAGTIAANAMGKVTLGVDNVVQKTKDAIKATEEFGKKLSDNAKNAAKVADMRAKADKLDRDLTVQRAEANQKRADLLVKAEQREQYTREQRVSFLKEAQKIDEDITNKEIESAKLRYEAVKLENTLSESNKEAKQAEAEAQAKVIQLDTQRLMKAKEVTSKIAGFIEQEKALIKSKNDALISLNNELQNIILDNEDKTNENQLALIEAKYESLFRLNENNTDALIELEKQKNDELTALDELQKEDDLTRLEVALNRELEANKGSFKIQEELKKAFEIDKVKIEIDAKNKKLKRDKELTDKEKKHNLDRIANEQKTADELALINAELNLKNSAGLANEQQMFKAFQDEKIRIIRENAEREIELNNLVGQEAEKVRAKALLDVKNVEGQKFTATEVKNEKELTAEQLKLQKQTTVALNSANQLSGALFQVTQSRLTKELNLVAENYNAQSDALNKQLEDGLITENEYLTQKANIDKQFKKQEAKIKEEQFKKQKQADLISSIINTAVGVTQAIPNVPLMAIAGILGATQTALIASQPTPKFAKGGVFGGNSHANGGTKGVFSDGTKIEVEKDEAFFVLNKKATQKISALSNLNQSTGGVPLMANGGAVNFNSGMTASVVASNVDSQNNMTNQLLSLITNLPTPVVAVQDINNAQNSLMNVVNFASF